MAAELLIRLRIDPVTRKKNLIIDYQSDEDALPMEHEDMHRQLVDQIIEGGALKAEELGKVIIRRSTPQQIAVNSDQTVAVAEPQGQKAGE